MLKEIKAFITRDDFVNNIPNNVAPLFELSDISLTYSKNKQIFYDSTNTIYSLFLFNIKNGTTLTQIEVNSIIKVIKDFSSFLTSTLLISKSHIILSFVNNFNTVNSSTPITNFNYNDVINYGGLKAPDYITFEINNILCRIWLSDNAFKVFYPDYNIQIVTPFENFNNIINNVSAVVAELDNFSLVDFNIRIELDKQNNPTTYTRILNIPYKIPSSNITKNCYFGFNIYGIQGNYEFILKLELYNYLLNVVGLTSSTIESIFPSLLKINEFFIIPRWNYFAIPTQVGQNGINSQVVLAYNRTFDINKFIKVYGSDNTIINYLQNNTYNVPFDYNNILLNIVNGYHTEDHLKDFKENFKDLITVSSTHPDFSRMTTKTQQFVTLLMNMLTIADSDNSTEMFNKIIANSNELTTRIITRDTVEYISQRFENWQIYVLPKYEYIRLHI